MSYGAVCFEVRPPRVPITRVESKIMTVYKRDPISYLEYRVVFARYVVMVVSSVLTRVRFASVGNFMLYCLSNGDFHSLLTENLIVSNLLSTAEI